MIKLFTIAVAILLTTGARAQLMFKNNQKDTLFIAIAMTEDLKESSGWTSKGWFKLLPGDSAAVNKLSGAVVFYFLKTPDGRISQGGTRPFLVDKKDAFTIKKANAKSTKDANPAYLFVDFHEMKIPEQAQKDEKFMIIL
jgi:uncharacterized membrane protein